MPSVDCCCRLATVARASPDAKSLNLADPALTPLTTALKSTALWGLIALPVLIEAVLQAADAGILGSPWWRNTAYENGAFWAGLLYDWRPNYPGQPLAMFLSYSVLHSGLGHLLGNMLTLWMLGQRLLKKIGTRDFLLLYLVSALGGGVGFGVLSLSPQPMIGASGALFGLAGALIWLEAAERHKAGFPLWPVLVTVLGLVLLNVLMWLALGGVLAWETHLGGFIAGVGFGIIRFWRHEVRSKKNAP